MLEPIDRDQDLQALWDALAEETSRERTTDTEADEGQPTDDELTDDELSDEEPATDDPSKYETAPAKPVVEQRSDADRELPRRFLHPSGTEVARVRLPERRGNQDVKPQNGR